MAEAAASAAVHFPDPLSQLSEEQEDHEDVMIPEQLQEVEEQFTAAVRTDEGQQLSESMVQKEEEGALQLRRQQ